MRAPVNGFKSLVDITLLEHIAENLYFSGFELGVHGNVRMSPVGIDAESLEFPALTVNEVLCELVAGAAEFGNAHFLAVQLVFLDNCALDGHTVVIPAGYVRNVITFHGL